MDVRYSREAACRAIAESSEQRYGVLLARGTLELGYYAPRGTDPQQPHDQDEIYIVMRGSGRFVVDGNDQPVETGDALFVAAGVAHRFEDFTDDFEAWVIFYGANGGEKP